MTIARAETLCVVVAAVLGFVVSRLVQVNLDVKRAQLYRQGIERRETNVHLVVNEHFEEQFNAFLDNIESRIDLTLVRNLTGMRNAIDRRMGLFEVKLESMRSAAETDRRAAETDRRAAQHYLEKLVESENARLAEGVAIRTALQGMNDMTHELLKIWTSPVQTGRP